MITQMFTIYDAAIAAYQQPFYMRTIGEAIRAFSNVCNDQAHEIGRHPDQFTLFHLGEYDDNTGAVMQFAIKKSLGVGVDFVTRTHPSQEVSDPKALETALAEIAMDGV